MKHNIVVIIFLVYIVIISTAFNTISDETKTQIQITPDTLELDPEEYFNISIYVIPGKPIRAMELKLAFTPSHIQALKIEEGPLFKDYPTLFNSGIIDNINGTIINVYGLILGVGNTTTPNAFANISLKTTSKEGKTTINLYDVIVTNETVSVPITTQNATLTIGDISGNGNGDSNGGGSPTNNPPSKPDKPFGPIYGIVNISYNFSIVTTDIDYDDLYYLFSWGDNTQSLWYGPVSPGNTSTMNHSWNKSGVYEIMAKAKDNDSESDWSPPLIITIKNQSSNENNTSPIANFTYIPQKPKIDDFIQFTDISIDTDGFVANWKWDFGDREMSYLQDPTHQYKVNKSYIVTLTVWDNDGSSNTISKNIKIDKQFEEDKKNDSPGFSLIFIMISILVLLYIKKRNQEKK
jgi:hypothetical protein